MRAARWLATVPPQNILDSRDIRATGATSISDLLDALAPQIGSSQGRGGEQPVLLLNGQRISSFRELRDIPPEAIERLEILPEEVALKYGYRADQKVVNIVLRQRFRSTTAQVGAGLSTDGGYANGNADLTKFMIEKNGRTTLNLHAEGNSLLTEDERNIILQETPPTGATTDDLLAARSLLPSKRDLRASGTFNRQLFGDVSGTLNTEVEHTDSRALVGLGDTLLEALARNTDTNNAHAGVTLNGTKSNWHWTLTSNADLAHTIRAPIRTNRPTTARSRPRHRATSKRPRTAICSSFQPAMRARRSPLEEPPLTSTASTAFPEWTIRPRLAEPRARRRSTSTCQSHAVTRTSARSAT